LKISLIIYYSQYVKSPDFLMSCQLGGNQVLARIDNGMRYM